VGRFVDNYTRHAVQRRADCKIPKAAFQMICKYWKEKRYKIGEGKRPLIRRLLIETEDEKKRQEIELEKRPRNHLLKERSDMEKYLSLRALRTDLERARTVIDVIRQREKKKLEQLLLFNTFIQQFSKGPIPVNEHTPLIFRIKICPEVLQALDSLRYNQINEGDYHRENKRKANSDISNDNAKVQRRDDRLEENDNSPSILLLSRTKGDEENKNIEKMTTQSTSNMEIDQQNPNNNTEISTQLKLIETELPREDNIISKSLSPNISHTEQTNKSTQIPSEIKDDPMDISHENSQIPITPKSFTFLRPSSLQNSQTFPHPIPINRLIHSHDLPSLNRIPLNQLVERETDSLTPPSPQEIEEHSFTEYPPSPDHTVDNSPFNTDQQQQKFIIYKILQTTTEEEE